MTDIEKQAEILSQKIRHYLITTMGRFAKDATDWEIFQGLSLALREEIMINWTATARTAGQKIPRRLYYLSMEYLPGRLLTNNISNLNASSLVQAAIKKLDRDYNKIIAIEHDPALGNGGLGRLASCLMDALATQRYPAMGYGLRYQYGIFEQQILEGEQIEKPDFWLLQENPWEYRRDKFAKTVKFAGLMKRSENSHEEEVMDLVDFEEVRAVPFDVPIVGYAEEGDFNVLGLRLWSTKESPHNFHLQRYNAGQLGPASENTGLTDVLYPNDNHETGKKIRLKQEFLLVSASLQDILGRHLYHFKNLDTFADKVRIQINDTHPALLIAELVRILTKGHAFTWKKAWETSQEVTSYTNHTILKEALEEWNQERMKTLLPRQYHIIERLNHEFCSLVRNKYPGDEEKVRRLSILENGQVRMAHLAIYGAHSVNGVARLHGEILKNQVFPDFVELYPEKFTYVTNGVTQRHWLWQCNPLLAEWITKRIGHKWLTHFAEVEKLKKFASDPVSQEEFLSIKRKNKENLAAFLNRPLLMDALFDVQVKRIHEYKRQLMNALHLIMLYHDLQENPHSRLISRTVFFAGKAAAGYAIAKDIIHLIYCLERKINADPQTKDKLQVVLIENYNVSKAEQIIPAAELSEQISTAGLEASGTGNMKLAINGALTIGTEDGANIEMRESIGDEWWPFSFGLKASEIEKYKNQYSPWDIYSSHPKIKKAVDALKDGSFTTSEKDQMALSALFDSLMLGYYGYSADRYFVLKDLISYYETQKKVEDLYSQPKKWAEMAIQQIAGMGPFSTDRAVKNYAEKIWKIEPCPIDHQVLEEVRKEFTLYIPEQKRIF